LIFPSFIQGLHICDLLTYQRDDDLGLRFCDLKVLNLLYYISNDIQNHISVNDDKIRILNSGGHIHAPLDESRLTRPPAEVRQKL
jgi:hypothetical protein